MQANFQPNHRATKLLNAMKVSKNIDILRYLFYQYIKLLY
jgi:hypothetical protein